MGNYLQHHGIKGQQWGVRRFQNEDGSLTTDGRERYRRGKELSKDLHKAQDREIVRMTKESKRYKDNERELKRLSEKYGLDPDTGEEDGYTSREHSKEDLRRAKDRFWQLQENRESLDMEISEKALKNAKKMISEQYGDTALSDIDYYVKKKSNIVNGFLLGFGTVLLAVSIKNQIEDKKQRDTLNKWYNS